jgi:hypothetical protein
LEWLRRIRALYRLNRRRLAAEKGSELVKESLIISQNIDIS